MNYKLDFVFQKRYKEKQVKWKYEYPKHYDFLLS